MNIPEGLKSPLRKVRDIMRILWCIPCHRFVLRRIRRRPTGQKIRVLFYVSDTSKWKCQTVYDAMEKSSGYDPVVAVSLSTGNEARFASDTAERELASMEAFFHKYGCRTIRVLDAATNAYTDAKTLLPDLVFLQQPWSVPREFEPWYLSRFALPIYVPYYAQVEFEPLIECYPIFFRGLFVEYLMNESWSALFSRTMKGRLTSCVYYPAGQPALDALWDDRRTDSPTKDLVVYAPHFSFKHPHNSCYLPYGTFEWNGREILAYAKCHPEIKWLFKPHPSLAFKLRDSGLMTQQEVVDYYESWRKIGESCTEGNYQHLFKRARAMITDCGSFLVEFGVTGMPIIHLLSNEKIPGIELSRPFLKTYYEVAELDEMFAAFAQVIERDEDPKRNERLSALKQCGLVQNNATQNIMNHLDGILARWK